MKTIIVILVFLCCHVQAQTNKKIMGRIAPAFTLENIDGGIVSLKDFRGKGPVLLCFIGIGCITCIQEMTEYQKIYEEYKDSQFVMLGIPLVNEKSISKVKPFIKSRKFVFPVLSDPNSEVAHKYYVQAVPFSVLINREGKIVYTHTGYMRGDEIILKQKIEELLN